MEEAQMRRKIGVIGSGIVGQTLAEGFQRHGYEVMRGTRDPGKLAEWGRLHHAAVGTMAEAARFGDLVVLAVKGAAAEAALELCGLENLAGKIVIDTTNPLAAAPPDNGVLRFFTTLEDSLLERLERKAPAARFVKAFSCVGNALMVDPELPGGPPSMFYCGRDAAAKAEVEAILRAFGHQPEDMGGAEAARAIEPLCILWCIPGFLHNDWAHAYKVLRQ
jgi:predicted dinucleotide-binding enzyme